MLIATSNSAFKDNLATSYSSFVAINLNRYFATFWESSELDLVFCSLSNIFPTKSIYSLAKERFWYSISSWVLCSRILLNSLSGEIESIKLTASEDKIGFEAKLPDLYKSIVSIQWGSDTTFLPILNALVFWETATPFISMAFSIDSLEIGIQPDWKAAPITMKFACILLPKKCSDNSVAFNNVLLLEYSLIKSIIKDASGYSSAVDLTISPVGISDVEITEVEFFELNFAIFFGFTPVSKSKTKYASDSPFATLLEYSLSLFTILRWETTEPPFWLNPVWSSAITFLSSINAAVEIIWLTVTTPVPPIPSINILVTFFWILLGFGRVEGSNSIVGNFLLSSFSDGITWMKEGQFPSTQE